MHPITERLVGDGQPRHAERAARGLQDLIGLTPGNLITHLRKLEDAGYITTEKNGSGVTARTSVALTLGGRSALERYSAVLRELLDSATPR
jgi:DNA-binding MarR family transcriptional regulator